MDDGRPTPVPVSNVVEAKPTAAKTVVIVGGVLAVLATVVGIVLWTRDGSGLSYFLPRVLGTLLIMPLAGLLITMALSGPVTLTERLAGWANPTVEFTPWPPQLGRTMTAVYRRQTISARARVRSQTPVQVEAELVCEEWVQYTVGTDTHTESHNVVNRRWAAPAETVADGVEAVFTMTIPSDAGGPTVDLDNNKVRWRLNTQLSHPFGKRTAAKIDLQVEPVLDVDGLVGEGERVDSRNPEAGS